MTFLEIVNSMLGRFSESERPNAELWVNLIYGEIWAMESWDFRDAEDDVTVTTGSTVLSGMTADVDDVRGIWNALGERLQPMRARQWNDLYRSMEIDGTTGTPEAYKLVNGIVSVGPPSSETSTDYRMLYRKGFTALVADTDVPALPVAFHWLLSAGALATGQSHNQDPTAALSDPIVARGIEAMRRDFLTDIEIPGEQWGAAAWP
jgi:hypothetical protein